MERLLTPEEVADLLAVSLKTVGNWLRSGHLHGLKLGRLWRIPRPELERFLGSSPSAPLPGAGETGGSDSGSWKGRAH